jgi:hypothetical protein
MISAMQRQKALNIDKSLINYRLVTSLFRSFAYLPSSSIFGVQGTACEQ